MVNIPCITFFCGLLFLGITASAQVQNLVPNPGFDIITQCPVTGDDIRFAAPWKNATHDHSSLLHACSPERSLGVPFGGRSIFSYQWPRSGEGHAIIRIYWSLNNDTGPGNSEYLQVPMLQPLQEGKTYYAEFYISPDVDPRNPIYTDAVGLALSDTLYYRILYGNQALPIAPAIENRGVLIADTLGWTRVSGCFSARGGERFAIVGNFRNGTETMVVFGAAPSYPALPTLY